MSTGTKEVKVWCNTVVVGDHLRTHLNEDFRKVHQIVRCGPYWKIIFSDGTVIRIDPLVGVTLRK